MKNTFLVRANQKGFTLIELLVVITIIGILATGATTIYTSAQQKARDSIRQNDILAIRSAIEQSYGDNAFYPQSNQLFPRLVTAKYMQSLPSDPKSNQTDSNTRFLYTYGSSRDHTNFVAGQEYELSANFENTGNAQTKEVAEHDHGEDDTRWEIGVNMDQVNSSIDTTASVKTLTIPDNTYGGGGVGTMTVIDGTTS